MNNTEFFNQLKKVHKKNPFYVTKTGKIRTKKGECPICAVANELNKTNLKLSYAKAAKQIGLCWNTSQNLCVAADYANILNSSEAKYRKQMLQICEN